MTSPVLYLVAENPAANHSVHLLLTNNNHFDTLKQKDNSNTLSYSKIKKKDYKKIKETQVIKPEITTNTWEKIRRYMLIKH